MLVIPPDLTAGQTGIWLDQQLFADKPIYNTGQAVTIRGELRVDIFEAALRDVIAEAVGLRLLSNPEVQPLVVTHRDLRHEPDPLAAAEALMHADMRVPISLADGTLYRFQLLRVANDRTIWFQKYHHIIIDATGRQLLTARTAARYRALRFGEPLAPINAATPADLLGLERAYAASADHAADRAYWIDRFTPLPEPLLETDRQGTERARSGCHARVAFALKRADFERLEAAARSLDVTTFRIIIALVYALFSRLYDRSELVLGLAFANRPGATARQAIGMWSKHLPVRLSVDRGTTIADAVRHCHQAVALDYQHRRFPIHELLAELETLRQGRNGLFDVVVNFLPIPYDFRFEDAPVTLANLSYGFVAPCMVSIADTGGASDLAVTVDTDPGLIGADEAARISAGLEMMLRCGVDDLACPLGHLPMISESTRERLLEYAAGETVALAPGETLSALCAARARAIPDAIAVTCGQQHLTYRGLHERASRMAGRLAAMGVGPGVTVGIALPRTPDLIVAVLAVHKAGGAYLPLDPEYPAERIDFIVNDAAVPVIVTTAALARAFTGSRAVLLRVDVDPWTSEPELTEPSAARPDDLAYVIYTSGSTGRPKGVGIAHRHVINLLHWGRSILTDDELDGLLFSTSLNFDLSVFEMFLPLVHGGHIVMVENLLALRTARLGHPIRLINTGPTLLDALLRTGTIPATTTTIILCGEKLPRHLADWVFAVAPTVRLLNVYGPTETTVYSSWARVDPSERSDPPIGRGLTNTFLYVLDSDRQLLPPGATGELFIGGAGVAGGYLGRPDLTQERFLPNPFGLGTIYRTGDRVRWRSDGALEFLGRVDNQIKMNGIRIEPGEIEAALRALPGIAAATVLLRDDDAGGRRLVAYLVPTQGAETDTAAARAALERTLPVHMVPASFMWIGALPMTPNGKLDRNALPAPARENREPHADRQAETVLERDLAAIWQDLLRIPAPSVHADFFDLGGDSLALINLFSTIDARFGRHVTVDMMGGRITIAELSRILTAADPSPVATDAVAVLQPLGAKPPFFCVPGFGGDMVHLYRLAVHTGTERPFLVLRGVPGDELCDRVDRIAAGYVPAIMARQPTGPIYLGGYSFGAVIAYEVARQLIEQGRDIGLLAIIDQRRPGWRLSSRNAWPTLRQSLKNLPDFVGDELATRDYVRMYRDVSRKLRRWGRAAIGLRPDLASVVDLSRFTSDRYPIFEAHLRALRSYQARRCGAPIAVFRAKVQPLTRLYDEDALGWATLTDNTVAVHIVPGNHYTMVTEPLVRNLGECLAAVLESAWSESSPVPRIEQPSGSDSGSPDRSHAPDRHLTAQVAND